MKRKNDPKALLLLLLGLFSMTQINIIGYLGISELVCYALAPFLFVSYQREFKRWGLMPYLSLVMLWAAFALISDFWHDQDLVFMLKGVAPVYCYFSIAICSFVLLHDNINRFKWFVVGVFLTNIISIFIFQPGSAREINGELLSGTDAVNAVIGYKLFFSSLVANLILLPVKLAFIRIPIWLSLGSVFGVSLFSLLVGGRSAFAMQALCGFLLWWGRGVRSPGFTRPKNLMLLILGLGLVLGTVSAAYKIALAEGWMGEEEVIKYEKQTRHGSSPLKMLMAGRSEFFVGLLAALDSPLIGQGSKAIDTKGFRRAFIYKYGDEEDLSLLEKATLGKDYFIPAHSHVVEAWMWHGLGGLFFWCYVLWILFRTLKQNMFVIPQMFAYLALVLPGFVWNIFFSPMGTRVGNAFLIVCCLMVNKIGEWHRKGIRLPTQPLAPPRG